jgi:NAD(P)-dependent dehydrogenase (short-subunit alcohol dehydrogenase family)
MQIRDRVILVTGANRGIGRAFVQELLAAGARTVYAAARRRADLDPVVALDPQRVRPVVLDITDAAQVAAATQAAGEVSVLINNAGAAAFGTALTVDEAAARRDMEVNYFGTLAMVRAFAPVIERNGGGAIINLLSVVSLASMPGIAVYNASKAAAWSLTQALRADLAPRGISVHGVFPGPVDTDMAKDIPFDKTAPAEVARITLAGIESGVEDIFPDPMAQGVYAAWTADHKAVERQFATM